jgi:uncharacterized hydrophobic protein (TIGR00271 family)
VGVAHFAVFRGAAVRPSGDVVEAVIARESADGLLADLSALSLDHDGAITLETLDTVLSDAADAAEEAAPGQGSDAVVWDELVARTGEDSRLTVGYQVFLTIACLLAAIGAITDSPVTVVGAMVLGPEFGPLAALAVGLVHHRRTIARRAGVSLVVGFAVAIALTALAVALGRLVGWYGTEVLTADRPATGFITQPDRWSVVVAVLAGIAGVLSLTAAKSGALVGVFISVTTVPAAADIAVSLALGGGDQLASAALQLGIILVSILVAATATLALQRALWHRVPRSVPSMDRVPHVRSRS